MAEIKCSLWHFKVTEKHINSSGSNGLVYCSFNHWNPNITKKSEPENPDSNVYYAVFVS